MLDKIACIFTSGVGRQVPPNIPNSCLMIHAARWDKSCEWKFPCGGRASTNLFSHTAAKPHWALGIPSDPRDTQTARGWKTFCKVLTPFRGPISRESWSALRACSHPFYHLKFIQWNKFQSTERRKQTDRLCRSKKRFNSHFLSSLSPAVVHMYLHTKKSHVERRLCYRLAFH